MQQDSIERIRSASFSISRKGYDKREVERFLNKLADWLETGGGDQTRSEIVQRELERVGEKTGRILAEAEAAAEEIRSEAADEAAGTLEGARERAEQSQRSAEQRAREAIDEAESRARRIADEGERRRADVETVISDLVGRRDALLAELEQLTSDLESIVAGHSESGRVGGGRLARPAVHGSEAPEEGDPAEAPGTTEQ